MNNDKIFAGTEYGVYLSTDFGTTWTQNGLINKTIISLISNGNNIFAGLENSPPECPARGNIYYSNNYGNTWDKIGFSTLPAFSITVCGDNIFVGAGDSGVYKSTNNGANWTQTSLNDNSVRSLLTIGNNIFAGTFDSGIYFSTNNGVIWNHTNLNHRSINCLSFNGYNIFAGTDSGIYISNNSGEIWTLASIMRTNIFSVISSNNIILAGTYNNGVFLSTNNGLNWINKNQGLYDNTTVLSSIITNNYVYAGTLGYSVWRRSFAEIIGIKPISENVPSTFLLYQNYPNPFNPTTKIKFDITANNPLLRGVGEARGVYTQLKIYDITGREISTLVNEQLSPGTYEVTFDGSNIPSGIYFYQLKTNTYSETKKMLIIK